MIVCHCNVLTRNEINEAIEGLIADDAYRLITPGVVYRELGKRGKCCGCFPQVVSLIVQRLEEFQSSDPRITVDRIMAGAATASLSAAGARLALKADT